MYWFLCLVSKVSALEAAFLCIPSWSHPSRQQPPNLLHVFRNVPSSGQKSWDFGWMGQFALIVKANKFIFFLSSPSPCCDSRGVWEFTFQEYLHLKLPAEGFCHTLFMVCKSTLRNPMFPHRKTVRTAFLNRLPWNERFYFKNVTVRSTVVYYSPEGLKHSVSMFYLIVPHGLNRLTGQDCLLICGVTRPCENSGVTCLIHWIILLILYYLF